MDDFASSLIGRVLKSPRADLAAQIAVNYLALSGRMEIFPTGRRSKTQILTIT
jgi:hypothetical protein